jgi:hypothetical protein
LLFTPNEYCRQSGEKNRLLIQDAISFSDEGLARSSCIAALSAMIIFLSLTAYKSEASAQEVGSKPSFGVATPMDAAGAVRKPAGPGLQEVTIVDSKGFNKPITVLTVASFQNP